MLGSGILADGKVVGLLQGRMEYTEDGYKRIVSIHEQDGRTRIGLASVGEPASN